MEVDYKLYFWLCRLGIFAEPDSLANRAILLPRDIAQKFESGFIVCKILESLKTRVKSEENSLVNFKTVKDTAKIEEIIQNWNFLLALLENGYSIKLDRKTRELVLELDKTMICELVNILFEKFHVLDTDFQKDLENFEQRVKDLWVLRGMSAQTDASLKNRVPTPYHDPQREQSVGRSTPERSQTGRSVRIQSVLRGGSAQRQPTENTADRLRNKAAAQKEQLENIAVHDYEDNDHDVDGGSNLGEDDQIREKHLPTDKSLREPTHNSKYQKPTEDSVLLNQSEFMEGSQISVLENSLLLNKSLLQIECKLVQSDLSQATGTDRLQNPFSK